MDDTRTVDVPPESESTEWLLRLQAWAHGGDALLLEAADELSKLRKDAERYRKLREAGSSLKLYVYEDQADPCSGDWQYKPSPEDVDAFADGLGAA